MIIGSKNKGDWSEFYVLLYLLGSRKLYAADEALHKVETSCFPINKIMRHDSPSNVTDFVLKDINKVEVYLNHKLMYSMTSDTFKTEAEVLYARIVEGNGSFDIPYAEDFLNKLYLQRLAAPSENIADIKMELHDKHTGFEQIMGFSIKSHIGKPPTLLNASGATNFIYEVIGLDRAQIEPINAINTKRKIKERIQAIHNAGGELRFIRAENSTFSANMMMVDSMMESIIAEMLRYSFCEGILDCQQLVDKIESINPFAFPKAGLYKYKFKQFLCAKALGLEPAADWSGEDEANGGYIVTKSDGKVLAYHIYNRDKFKKYLLDNTKLERASTSRFNYALLYQENSKIYIKLNLQIRFK